MAEVSFSVSNADFDLIQKITDRAMSLQRQHVHARERSSRQAIMMDFTAVHANGNPLRLADLLAADDFNFSHDFFGIRNCLDRQTGQLMNHFRPRFSRPERSAA